MRRRRLVLFGLLPAALLAALFVKATRAPEWTVLTGDAEARQAICLSVYKKSPPRAAWMLRRLLADPVPAVRVTALDALQLRPDLRPAFADRVRALAESPSGRVRARALEFVLDHDDLRTAEWVDRAADALADPAFRRAHPALVALHLSLAGNRGDAAAFARLVDWLETDGPAGAAPGYDAAPAYPELLRPHRARLVDCLGTADGAARGFVLQALAAVDGRMRGTDPADWRLDIDESAPPARPVPLTRFTVEAEWPHRIRPNFQIDDDEGPLSLVLREGAGGAQFWRKAEHPSVDIGQADYVFPIAQTGRYQVWMRCWFSDKCGNHSNYYIDGRWRRWRRVAEDDRHDRLRVWHWKRIERRLRLTEGRHTLRIRAADDGMLYDRIAVLPADETFDPEDLPPLRPLWDASLPTHAGFTTEMQAQLRGTTQTVAVRIRRTAPRIAGGTVALSVPPPFRIEGKAEQRIRFDEGVPLATAAFRVRLPAGATAGERVARAVFTVEGETEAAAEMILGAQLDWWTTGPLAPDDPLCQRLLAATDLPQDKPGAAWTRFPAKGFDRYRRLDFERAFGELRDRYVFLYTELDVAEAGEFVSLLNIDDRGWVRIDGRRVTGRDENGVGEGRLHVERIRLDAGRRRVFAWVYQSEKADATGAMKGRKSPNHCNLKWLLRKGLHAPAPAVRGVPVGE